MSDGTVVRIDRRPEYIEAREKSLLDAIFGAPIYDGEELTGFEGGLLQGQYYDPTTKSWTQLPFDPFTAPPVAVAAQAGRGDPTQPLLDAEGNVQYDAQGNMIMQRPQDIVGFGLETYPVQALSTDANADGVPDFLQRYDPFFQTGAAYTTSGAESLYRGLGALGSGQSFFGPAAQYVSSGRGMYDPADYVQNFMSPYTENVIQEVEKDIERQGDVARQRSAAQAVGSGAFGGSRQGVQAAEVERAILDAKSKAAADLRAQNYNQALNASQNAYNTSMTRELEAGRLMGGLGQSLGTLGGVYGSLGGTYGSLGGTTADMGRVYAGLGPADLSYMGSIGEAERGYRQMLSDVERANVQSAQQGYLAPYQFGYGALSGTPSAGVTSTTQNTYSPQANPYVSGFGLYSAISGINQG